MQQASPSEITTQRITMVQQMRLLKDLFTARNLYAWSVGVTAGGVVGTVGFGGAQVVIPSLTASSLPGNVASYSQLAATGISLSSLSISTISSGYNFWKENKVHIPLALAIGIPAVVAARLGTNVARRISHDALALFFNGFSIILMPTHYYIQHRKSNIMPEKEDLRSSNNHQAGYEPTATILLQHSGYGFFSGILSALMGVGGLPITISYLTVSTDLHHHTIQGTAVCSLIPAILVSAASRWSVVPVQPALFAAAGAVLGSYAGSHFALHLDEDRLRQLYMGSLVLFGSRSVYGAIANLRNILRARK